jgi:hypothetical protein
VVDPGVSFFDENSHMERFLWREGLEATFHDEFHPTISARRDVAVRERNYDSMTGWEDSAIRGQVRDSPLPPTAVSSCGMVAWSQCLSAFTTRIVLLDRLGGRPAAALAIDQAIIDREQS